MTATDRSTRQSRADHEGRTRRVQAMTRDLLADLDYYTTMSPTEGPVITEVLGLLVGAMKASPGFFHGKLHQLEHSRTDAAAVEAARNAGDFQAHVFDGGRCVFCNTNDLDEDLYGPFDCIRRGQFVYTTETPASPSNV